MMRCGAWYPDRGEGKAIWCTEPAEHSGDHVARFGGDGVILGQWPADADAQRQSWAMAPLEWFVERVAQMNDSELTQLARDDDAGRAALQVMREGARLARFLRKSH
jgi:hypothetical protein